MINTMLKCNKTLPCGQMPHQGRYVVVKSASNPPKFSSLSKINEINERILILRHELRQTAQDDVIPLLIEQDQTEEILAAINDLKTAITNHDPLEEMCVQEPHASECKLYDV